VKGGVDGGLSWLIRNRERDPYKDLVKRLAYEFAWGNTRTAPTFSLPSEKKKQGDKQGVKQMQEEVKKG
jgi:hypothetical protein